ncbi:unnamed protein product [Vicia faba]|uniref:Reverse transcriptase domain-containing protein n=1 Tax=Vicia faba TaxID=3906 RepID=A0AAV1AMJ9_VICFA|nr:unnamed protein product [Vicia faba]
MLSVETVSYRYIVNDEYTKLLMAKRGLRQGDPLSPMIFVLVMDYLYRILQKLKSNPNFNFHANCEKLGIINLSFADDLLLFSRGDSGSVNILLQSFNNFSSSTGLGANPMKCRIYFGNVNMKEKDDIKKITTF